MAAGRRGRLPPVVRRRRGARVATVRRPGPRAGERHVPRPRTTTRRGSARRDSAISTRSSASTTGWSTPAGGASEAAGTHHLLSTVLDVSPSGFVALDYDGPRRLANPRPKRSSACRSPRRRGVRLADLRRRSPRASPPSRPDGRRSSTSRRRSSSQVLPRRRSLDRGFPRAFILMDELTEELRLYEKAAYEKLIRMMSHEVNNSLGASNSLLHSCLNYARPPPAEPIAPTSRTPWESLSAEPRSSRRSCGASPRSSACPRPTAKTLRRLRPGRGIAAAHEARGRLQGVTLERQLRSPIPSPAIRGSRPDRTGPPERGQERHRGRGSRRPRLLRPTA